MDLAEAIEEAIGLAYEAGKRRAEMDAWKRPTVGQSQAYVRAAHEAKNAKRRALELASGFDGLNDRPILEELGGNNVH